MKNVTDIREKKWENLYVPLWNAREAMLSLTREMSDEWKRRSTQLLFLGLWAGILIGLSTSHVLHNVTHFMWRF